MSAWQSLDAELELWRDAERRAAFWLRDDDACRDSAALQRMLETAEAASLPVGVAAIPATLEPSLADAVARSRFVTVIQHGYAHRNHAPPEERKMELGPHRGADETLASLLAVSIRCGEASASDSLPFSSRRGTGLATRSLRGCLRSGCAGFRLWGQGRRAVRYRG